MRAELVSARAGADELSKELEQTRRQLHELQQLADLQSADIEKAILDQKEPRYPERVHPDQLQLAMERVLEALTDAPALAAARV